ncbi:Translation initiation factor 4E [Monocercomonoides exilis]|uniref:Translation initiation factor 4E n=1 Tax=Monocercomonoides exilis TaxID=2049356 RepID=UPI0035595715|nr:Translation initiation factor 4E [Monocercomonoides exilis]|eukprot:MONOS_13102.1-p1 / transcript=MONOS_13102.1 / gene=MONOS_13102 / organism=Monocercomonoides_exilis_PA203 / gene_product=Translation initiation factor 4E / transcript_product=Translation initiation factor 4E / location=Mono_scaffold00778:11380-12120(-) / protein_length=195 / sequence_SO=supercontig / SO=protein_coding / is_pseudo=false
MTKLETPWSFWIDRRAPFSNRDTKVTESYVSSLKLLGTFSTIEEFWAYQSSLATVDKFPKDVDFHCFRTPIKPCWEELPEGGSWNLRFRETSFRVGLWESLLLAAIGEQFREQEVVGVCLSIRPKDDCLSVWFRHSTPEIKRNTEDLFRQILNLDHTVALEFKSHTQLLRSVKASSAKRANEASSKADSQISAK